MSIILGMDVGGTSIKLGAWEGSGRIAWRDGMEVPPFADTGRIGDQLKSYITDFLTELPGDPIALGIGSCGLISGGVVFQSPNTPWDTLPLVEVLSDRLKYPIYLINDADAFLISAMDTLPDRNCVALGITLGTGIGTALWLGDRLLSGGAGVSPEGGHITLGIDRAEANTGIPGSWEQMAGRDALLRHYKEAGGEPTDNPREIAKRAREGEAPALTAWNRYGRYVGAGIGSLSNVLSPDYVLIGGGMAKSHALFEVSLNAALDRHRLRAMPRPEIMFLDDRDDVVAQGGALYAGIKLSHGR